MKRLPLLAVPLLVCALSSGALQRRWTTPNRPEPLDTDSANPAKEHVALPRRIDLVQLQKQADDLARTAQTIPSDMASLRRGMLPKDVIQKLKQIEKLSKQLRSQISQ